MLKMIDRTSFELLLSRAVGELTSDLRETKEFHNFKSFEQRVKIVLGKVRISHQTQKRD